MISFSSITDRLTQLTIPQKIVLAVSGIVFLGVVLGFFLLMPLWEESKNLREDISREKMKLAQMYSNPGTDHPVQTRAGRNGCPL